MTRMRPIRLCVVSIALSIAFGSVTASLERGPSQNQKTAGVGSALHQELGRLRRMFCTLVSG
jgi:hypothetical protein